MVFGKSETDDVSMRSGVRPALVKDKITQRIVDGFAMVDFRGLPNVGMMAMNNVGTGINQLTGQINPPGFGIG